jgi:acetyl esterase/lipase
LAAGPVRLQTDGVSDAFLVASILGFALTVNAMRPLPGPVAVPSFFASWLTMELAPQILVIHVLTVTGFVLAGAPQGTKGTVALALCAATAAGLVYLIGLGMKARDVTEAALRDGLGPQYAGQIAPMRAGHHDLRVPWRQLLLPFSMKHPDVERLRNIRYAPKGRRRSMLDVYRPRSGASGAPVLLQIHGGAWMVDNKDHQGRPLMLQLASRGWVCVAINYRLAPKHPWPAQIVDVKRALAWIRSEIETYGGDPSFVVVTGGSAGGHLAALTALTPNDPDYQPGFEDADTTVQACVPHYGVYDMTGSIGGINALGQRLMLERFVFKKRYRDAAEEFRKASPLFRANPDAPPFFVIHGRYDSLVPVKEARAFVTRLREVSHEPVVYAELPGGQHAFDVFPSIRTAHVVRAVERFADWCWSTHHPATKDAEKQPLP